ncbi:MAG: hypothetical protein V7K67_16595 [Nostoc sp.]|uniref:hypothetical protein n=1 Tax=Nostoc sp. TaxID=1180 RepID=UPI002FF9D062
MSKIAQENGIWVPDDLRDLLTVHVPGDADESTVNGMITINGAANEWLTGKMDGETYFDLLAQHGIDPVLFVGEVYEHIQWLIR